MLAVFTLVAPAAIPPELDLTDAASLPEGALKVFPTPNGSPQIRQTLAPTGQPTRIEHWRVA